MAMKLDLDDVLAAAEQGDDVGFCVACGAQHDDCEPDLRKGQCEACGRFKVYGAEEILAILVP